MDKYESLNEMQQRAVYQTEGPVLILAGAGSGKTKVLTNRISYLVEEMSVSPWHILAITFTNKAAREMKERAFALSGTDISEAWICTFHSACLRILKRYADRIGYDKNFTIYDPDDQKAVIRRIMKELNISDRMFTPKAVLGEISSAKNELVSPREYADKISSNDLFRKKTAQIYEAYEKNLHENQAMDFDDLLGMTVLLLRQQPDVLDYLQEKFRYIMVDEYQDTNNAQYQLIRLLSSKYRNLCVVGDDDQSIYRFRGADIHNILNFEKDFPDALVVRLEQNYRSTGKILKAANGVIRNNESRKSKTLWTRNPEGSDLIVHECENENDEAAYVVSQISREKEQEKIPYLDNAVLYRTNAQSRALEEHLVLSGIPYRLYGGTPFYQRREIKDLLCYLRLVVNDYDYAAAERIINVPQRGIGDVTFERLRQFAQDSSLGIISACVMAKSNPDLKRSAQKLTSFAALFLDWRQMESEHSSIRKIMTKIIEKTEYLKFLQADDPVKFEDRRQNLDELMTRADQYESQNTDPENPATLQGFLDELSLVAAIDEYEEGADVVSLMTLHSAKGLEFRTVFMTGMEDGVFPGYRSIVSYSPEDLEEERRLCYVGITRARKNLYLTYAQNRHINGAPQYMTPSRFLKELPQDVVCWEKLSGGYETSGGTQTSSSSEQYKAVRTRQKSLFQKEISDKNPYVRNIAPLPGKPSDDVPVLKKGDTVYHKKFGMGTVTEVKSVNADYQVRVLFAKAGEKLLFARLAGLKKM